MLSALYIPYLRIRLGVLYAVLFLAVLGLVLPDSAISTTSAAIHLPFDGYSIHAEEGMYNVPVISEGHDRHSQFSPRAKGKIPSFFKRSVASYTDFVLFRSLSDLYTLSFLRSQLLRPGYYLFLFRYTPF